MSDFYSEDQRISIEQAIAHAKVNHEYLGEGRNRIVFLKGDGLVIKIPKNDWGISDNRSEARLFKEHGKNGEFPYAKCQIIEDENGIPILEMERVYPLSETDEVPSWAKYVDCGQIGKTINGEIVAYDYSQIFRRI